MKSLNLQIAEQIIIPSSTIFWFRRDLRLQDNAGLYAALKENKNVIPVFIFDTEILNKLEDKTDRRVEFIHQSLRLLKTELEAMGSSLLVLHGNPVDLYKKLNPKAVYANHDYEPYSRKRDAAVKSIFEKREIAFKTFKDQVIFEKNEIVKDDGNPYTIFTPYSRKWKANLNAFFLSSYPVEKYSSHFLKTKALPFPTVEDLGFKSSGIDFPERVVKASIINKYDTQRNFPAIRGRAFDEWTGFSCLHGTLPLSAGLLECPLTAGER